MANLVADRLSAIFRTEHGLDDSVNVFSIATPAVPKLKGELAPFWVNVTDQTQAQTTQNEITYGIAFSAGYNNRIDWTTYGTVILIKYPTGVADLDY